jgi:hypothetical protein
MRSSLLISIVAALAACEDTHAGAACLTVPAEQTSCPAADSLDPADLFVNNASNCGATVVELTGEGKRELAGQAQVEACCYPAEVTEGDDNCVVGRPYCDGRSGRHLQAPWCVSETERSGSVPDRAAAWALAGAGEHASVAAFARLSLQLMALGAPNALLRDVHQAALDEVGHAERCWQLAETFGGARPVAGPFPFADETRVRVSLAELAVAAVREGCLAETLGAYVLGVAAEHAPEAEVREALTSMAAEEARHAVLSFRIVAWALRTGNAEVKASVRAAFAQPWPRVDVAELSLRSNVDLQLLAAAAKQGLTDVLAPAAAHLLAA